MSTQTQSVLKDALALSEPDRALIASRLIESLDGKFDDDVESAWEAEIAKRIDDIDSGRVTTVPWSQVHRRLSRKSP